jgi:hemerythrin-like domain-containing protein
MYNEHEIGRAYIRSALAALEQGQQSVVIEHLTAYGVLLEKHIRKEDEILYPWMNQELSDSQVGQLFSKFSVVDEQFDAKADYFLGIINKLEGIAPQKQGA